MSDLYFTTITERPLHGSNEDAKPVADVVFQTEKDALKVMGSVFDAVSQLGITTRGSSTLVGTGEIFKLLNLPDGKSIDLPEWSNPEIKLWVTRRAVQ